MQSHDHYGIQIVSSIKHCASLKKKFSQPVKHDFLKKFRKSWKNWYWPVKAGITLERSGKHTNRQRKVNYWYKGINNILKRLMNHFHGYIIICRSLVSAKWFNRRRPLVVAAKRIQKENGTRNRWATNLWVRFYLTNLARCW